MVDVVGLWNLALMRVGVTTTVADISEASNEARVCSVSYEMVRDSVLRDVPWSFASKRVVLALLAETAPTNWGYAYAAPSDCLFPRGIVVDGSRHVRPDERIPFEVNGTKIYCDIEEPELVYTAKIEDLTLWDAQAISALGWGLAAEIAIPLGKPDYADRAERKFRDAMSVAAASTLSEGIDMLPTCEFLQVRN